MKYLQKFESHNSNFIYDFESKDFTDKRGLEKIRRYLSTNNIDFKEFLEDVRENLYQFGVVSDKTLYRLVGGGQFGIAFEFLDKVLKITSSAKEFVTCMNLVDMEYEGLVRYYLAFQYKNLPIWIIVQDRLHLPSKMERDIYTTLYYMGANDIHHPEFKYKNNLFNSLVKRVKYPHEEDELPPYDINREDLKYYFDRYMDLVNNLRRQKLSTDDLHGENIGTKDGELIHFDIMII